MDIGERGIKHHSINKSIHFFKSKCLKTTKLDMSYMERFISKRVENDVGKAENAGNQHILLFLQCFQKALS